MFRIYDGRSQFYQWDTERKLIVEDATINEVHFCNRTSDCSLVCRVYEEQGLRLVNVPNVLLQTDWRINVYGYDIDYTKHCETFDVIKRSRPEDYVYTDEEQRYWDDLEARIEQIEESGVSDEAIANAVEKYLDENDISVDLTGYATETYVNEAVAAIELTPGPAGKDGYTPVKGVDYFDGKDGVDGKDYVLTEADKQEIAGMVEVSGGDVDLTNYYTKSEVDAAIEAVELIPGPTGPAGADGKDYVLTEDDMATIAAMVDVPDVSAFQTEAQVIALINEYASGEPLPAAEGVEF